MRRALPVLLIVVSACVAQPPERAPLPDVEDVLAPTAGCQINVGQPLGVIVVTVSSTGAAAGRLEEDDIITAIDGMATVTRPDLSEIMMGFGPGDEITVVYTRDGAESSVDITLGANPEDDTRGMIGVTVQTAFETVDLDSVDDIIEPSPTTRPIQVGDTIYLVDPVTNAWQGMGVTPPSNTRWVSTSTGLYSVTGSDPVRVLDLITGEPIADDGFRDWNPLRLIGSVADHVLVVVSAAIPDQPGFVNLGVAAFDPRSGETAWVSPVSNEFGVPVAAYGSPDDSAFLAVGANPESGEQMGVGLFNAAGAIQTTTGLAALGTPIGWHDDTRVAFRTSQEIVSIHDFIDGSTETFELPENLFGSEAAAVGDGENLLVVGERTLLLQSLADPANSSPLATNCRIGRTGDPGWGV